MSAVPEAPASAPAGAPDAPAEAVVVPGWPAEAGLVGMSVAAALGLGRLFANGSFVPPVLLAVFVSHGLAMACRRRSVGPVATALASALGLALFVTWVVEAHVSLVPGPAVVHAAWADLGDAWGRFSEVVAPTKVTRGFLLGAVLGAWTSAFVADVFAFRARTRVEAIVPSFTVFLFGALLGADARRIGAAALYLASVLVFVVLAEVSASARPRPWVAGLRRPGEASLVRSGLAMGLVALVVGLVVGPNLPGAYGKGVFGLRDRNKDKNGTRVTLSPLVDIRGRLVGQSNVELFTVATDTPTYWRITSLDRFDGSIWSSLSNYRPAATRLPGVGPDAGRADTTRSRQDFVIGALSSIWLPAAFRPDRLSPTSSVRFDPDSASLATDKATSDGLRYTVESSLPRLTASELATAAAAVPTDVLNRYLDLPPNLPRRIRTTALQVAGNEATPYKRAKALQDWFRTTFTYSTQAPPGHDGSAMDQFLTTRQGYCEQFAGTYAAMARMLGLPARVAVGFTPGTKGADGLWHVAGKDAHAWPEVYLSGYGWVAFEPTPGRGLPGAEDYTNVQVPQAADSTAATAPDTVAPAVSTTLAPDVTEPAPAAPAAGSPAGPRLVVVVLLAVAMAIYGAGVPLAKRRRRRLRRAAATTPARRVLVAWAEAAEDMAAAGRPQRPDETAPEFAHRVGRAVGPAGPALVRLADDASAAAWSADGVGADVAVRAATEATNVAAELRAQAGWRDRARRALDPRPLLSRPNRDRPVGRGHGRGNRDEGGAGVSRAA